MGKFGKTALKMMYLKNSGHCNLFKDNLILQRVKSGTNLPPCTRNRTAIKCPDEISSNLIS